MFKVFCQLTIVGTFLLLIFGRVALTQDVKPPQNVRLSTPPEVRICSQNLFNFAYQRPNEKKKTANKRRKKQLKDLVKRFEYARCDIVGLQELVGNSKAESKRILSTLLQKLKKKDGRQYQALLGNSFDPRIRNAAFYDASRVRLIDSGSLYRLPLPKLLPNEAFESFRRGPLWLEFEIQGAPPAPPKSVLLIVVHFKSRYQGFRDPRQTDFEVLRMQMAEATRGWLTKKLREKPGIIPIIIGDLNSDRDQAASLVLAGEYTLEDFQHNCLVNENYAVSCKEAPGRVSRYFRVFDQILDEGFRLSANSSYRYKKSPRLFDEAVMLKRDRYLLFSKGEPQVDFVGQLYRGSDHKLLYLELNW